MSSSPTRIDKSPIWFHKLKRKILGEEEEGDDTDDVETDLAPDVYTSILEQEAKSWCDKGWFVTSHVPSAYLRKESTKYSLIVWLLWIGLLGGGWWFTTSVVRSPLPLKEFSEIKKNVNLVNQTVSSFQFLKEQLDVDAIRRQIVLFPAVVVLPLCKDLQKSDLFKTQQQSVVVGFSMPHIYGTAISAEEMMPPASNLSKRLKRFCNHQSNHFDVDVLRSVTSSLQNILSHGKRKPNIIMIVVSTSEIDDDRIHIFNSSSAIIELNTKGINQFFFWDSVHLITHLWFGLGQQVSIHPHHWWRFLLLSENGDHLDWDFEEVQKMYLNPIFADIRKLIDLKISSHVILHASLSSLSSKKKEKDGIIKLTQKDLNQFQKLAGNWITTPIITPPTNYPLNVLQYACWVPINKFKGLVFMSPNGVRQSWSLPRWGSLAAVSSPTNSTAAQPTREQLTQSISIWMSHWRNLFGLTNNFISANLNNFQVDNSNCVHRVLSQFNSNPFNNNIVQFSLIKTCGPERDDSQVDVTDFNRTKSIQFAVEIPTRTGFSEWELSKIGRNLLLMFLKETIDSTEGFLNVLQQQSLLPVSRDLARKLQIAMTNTNYATRYFTDTSIDLFDALAAARQGLILSKECLFDPSMTTYTFFNLQFRAALYAPLALPFIFRILMAAMTEVKIWRKKRASKKQT